MAGGLIGPFAEMEGAEAFKPTGFVLTGEMEFDRGEALGRYLGALRDATAWALGDWFLFGERVFGVAHIARIATTTNDGSRVTGGQLEDHLTLGGFDLFQAAMGYSAG
jgi:hypothetical protein